MKGKFESIIKGDKPVIVDFFAEWCGPCKTQSPILKELAGEVGDKIKVIKVDVDKNPQIANQYGIQGVPTLMMFKNGKQVFHQSGVMSKPQLYQVLLNS